MRYLILFSSDTKTLCEKVNRHLQEGWELIGGASVSEEPDSYTFIQAVIHREKEPFDPET